MGADQIGYIVKGPVALDPALRETALVHLGQLQAEIRRALDAAGYKDDEGFIEDHSKFWDLSPDLDHELDPLDYAELAGLDAHKFISEFFDWWEHGARDTTSRNDPDDLHQCLTYAGEMSSGDEPEGHGYSMLRTMFRVPGLAELLGIR